MAPTKIGGHACSIQSEPRWGLKETPSRLRRSLHCPGLEPTEASAATLRVGRRITAGSLAQATSKILPANLTVATLNGAAAARD